jgi:hypothetical protein
MPGGADDELGLRFSTVGWNVLDGAVPSGGFECRQDEGPNTATSRMMITDVVQFVCFID